MSRIPCHAARFGTRNLVGVLDREHSAPHFLLVKFKVILTSRSYLPERLAAWAPWGPCTLQDPSSEKGYMSCGGQSRVHMVGRSTRFVNKRHQILYAEVHNSCDAGHRTCYAVIRYLSPPLGPIIQRSDMLGARSLEVRSTRNTYNGWNARDTAIGTAPILKVQTE